MLMRKVVAFHCLSPASKVKGSNIPLTVIVSMLWNSHQKLKLLEGLDTARLGAVDALEVGSFPSFLARIGASFASASRLADC